MKALKVADRIKVLKKIRGISSWRKAGRKSVRQALTTPARHASKVAKAVGRAKPYAKKGRRTLGLKSPAAGLLRNRRPAIVTPATYRGGK